MTNRGKTNDILSGCDDLLKDFSLPGSRDGEHTDRFVSIDQLNSSNSVTSSSIGSPGQAAVDVELARSKQAWGRAIDRYVASVLEDGVKEEGASKSGTSRSSRSKKSHKSHPDNYLLTALEVTSCKGDGTASVSSHRSVDGDGRVVDDSSFAPINPFGVYGNASVPYKDKHSRKEKVVQYLKEEWKPISLIALVILATIILSATLGGKERSTPAGAGGTKLSDLLDSVVVVDTPDVIAEDEPTFSPTMNPTFGKPTMSPSYYPTTALPTRSPVSVEIAPEKVSPASPDPTPSPTPESTPPPTLSPTAKPVTSSPTSAPSTKPSLPPTTSPSSSPTPKPTEPPMMPAEYYEMLKAVKYVSSEEAFATTSSAQSLAFHWLYYEGKPSTNLLEFFEQYAIAVVLFSLTQARTSAAYQGDVQIYDEWTSKNEVCGWDGVRCAYNYTSQMVHVTEILLHNRSLMGTIPDEISFLPYVNQLDLSDNQIVGTVPESVYDLSRLRHLYLNNNNLVGTISPSIDKLNLAEHIYLGQNNFMGTLPSSIGSTRPNNWRFFSVYDNHLEGPLHMETMKLKKAYMLDFSHNKFYGTISNEINTPNFSTLRMIYLNNNLLTGTIPDNLMQMRKMKALFLNDNLLTGMIPYNIDDEQKLNLLTIRAEHNRLTIPVAGAICALGVNRGEYELVDLGVDCSICPNDCEICQKRCY